jgi:hypothetical protein
MVVIESGCKFLEHVGYANHIRCIVDGYECWNPMCCLSDHRLLGNDIVEIEPIGIEVTDD